MMWEQIHSNKRKSMALVVLIAALLIVLGYVIGEAAAPNGGVIGLGVAFILWLILSMVAYFQGGNILLAVSGAHEIKHDDHPQLFNIVEEMKIAGALPKMPRVFIIDDMAMNAFATGRNPNDAAVAVTAGLLGRLNRDELQGVIAHEMSHIINRDVLLMSMVGVMLGTIVMISEVFLRSLWYSGAGSSRRYRSSSRDGGGGGQAQMVMAVVAIVLAILAPILAQLIYFAISRRREYLADANAVVLTRYPEGLASALEKIGGDTHVLAKANKATAPMFISNPLHKEGVAAAGLTSTHPAIAERVHILRALSGGVSYKLYETAWRNTSGKKAGHMPKSSLAADEVEPIRGATASDAKDTRQQMREAGDLLRKVNQFVFLPCACGLKLKLPPGFKQDHVACPRCGRNLAVPTAQLAAAAAAGQTISQQAAKSAPPALPLEVRRRGRGFMSFKCSCGKTHTLGPDFTRDHLTCSNCGRTISVHNE